MTRPYVGPAYTPREVRSLFIEETPSKFTQHSLAGRRTVEDYGGSDKPSAASASTITQIIQPEWTSMFWRLMSDDKEMAKPKNWFYFPVRRALAKLGEIPSDWGKRRADRRLLLKRAMTMFLISNYDVKQIATALGIKEHEAYRALVEASAAMTEHIGVFGEEFRAYDRHAFMEGLR